MKEITREEANKIILDHANKPVQRVTICFRGRWFDIRDLSKQDIIDDLEKIFGIIIKPEQIL